MASNIIKLIDYDEDQALFENFNDRIHIQTKNASENADDGATVSIDKEAARRLILWLQDTISPSAYYSKPTVIIEED